jgi:hypothetical protein
MIKCCGCGRFIPYSEMDEGGGARFYFEPDSHRGPEISEWTCAACMDKDRKHDAEYSMRNVR